MKNVIMIFACLLLLTLTACNETGGFSITPLTPQPTPTPVAHATPTPTPSTPPTAIQQEVTEYNNLRIAQGQDPVTQGLTCSLYTVYHDAQGIQGSVLTPVGSFTYTGVFNQGLTNTSSGLNILPAPLKAYYQDYYVLKCYGILVITNDAYNTFSLTSDDGANLYIDGLLLADDGNHSAITITGVKFLQQGVHGFELDYMQAGGQEELVLKMNGSVLPAANLYH